MEGDSEPIRVFARLRPVLSVGVFSPGAAHGVLSPRGNQLRSPLGQKNAPRAPAPASAAPKGLGSGFTSLRMGAVSKQHGLATSLVFDSASGGGGVDENGDSASSVAFELDGVLPPTCDQLTTFELLGAPAVDSVLGGYNACLLAYGRSGSGKTHTILGPTSLRRGDGAWAWSDLQAESEDPTACPSALGLVPRAVHALLRHVAEEQARLGWEAPRYTVSLACAEVYNNKLYDLLSSSGEGSSSSSSSMALERAEVREGRMTSAVERLMSWHPVPTAPGAGKEAMGQARALILRANAARIQASTELNLDSSRSHVLYMLRFASSALEKGGREATLSIVDLAGSETLDVQPHFTSSSSGSGGDGGGSEGLGVGVGGMGSPGCAPQGTFASAAARNAETRAINSSLHVLTRVVAAYANAVPGKRPPHVPFRESLLTLLLKDSIGGNSKTAVVVTMCAEDVVQSYRTAQFARLARGVRNAVRENKISDPNVIIAALRTRVGELQEALAAAAAAAAAAEAGSGSAVSLSQQHQPLPPSPSTPPPLPDLLRLLDMAPPPDFDHGALLEHLADFMEGAMASMEADGEALAVEEGGAASAADAAFSRRVSQFAALARALREYVRAAGQPLEAEAADAPAPAPVPAHAPTPAANAVCASVGTDSEGPVAYQDVGVHADLRSAPEAADAATAQTPFAARARARAARAAQACARLARAQSEAQGGGLEGTLGSTLNSTLSSTLGSSMGSGKTRAYASNYTSAAAAAAAASAGVFIGEVDLPALRAAVAGALIEACSQFVEQAQQSALPRLHCAQGVLAEMQARRAAAAPAFAGRLSAGDTGEWGGAAAGGSEPALAAQRDYGALGQRVELVEVEIERAGEAARALLEEEMGAPLGSAGAGAGAGAAAAAAAAAAAGRFAHLPVDGVRHWQWLVPAGGGGGGGVWQSLPESLAVELDACAACGQSVETRGDFLTAGSAPAPLLPATAAAAGAAAGAAGAGAGAAAAPPAETAAPTPMPAALSSKRLPSCTLPPPSQHAACSKDPEAGHAALARALCARAQDLFTLTRDLTPRAYPATTLPPFSRGREATCAWCPAAGAVQCGQTGAQRALRRVCAVITQGGMFKRVGLSTASAASGGGHNGALLWREWRLTPLGLFQLQRPRERREAAEAAARRAALARGADPALTHAASAAAGCAKAKVLFSPALRYRAELLAPSGSGSGKACPQESWGAWRIVRVGGPGRGDAGRIFPMVYLQAASTREAEHWITLFNAAAGGGYGSVGEMGLAPAAALPPQAPPPPSPALASAQATVAFLTATLARQHALRAGDLSYSAGELYDPPELLSRAAFASPARLGAAAGEVGIPWALGVGDCGMGCSPLGAAVGVPVHAGQEAEWAWLCEETGVGVGVGVGGGGAAPCSIRLALRLQNGLAALAFASTALAWRRGRSAGAGAGAAPAPACISVWVAVDSVADLALLCSAQASVCGEMLGRGAVTPQEARVQQEGRLRGLGGAAAAAAAAAADTRVFVVLRWLLDCEAPGEAGSAGVGAGAMALLASASSPPPKPSIATVSLAKLLATPAKGLLSSAAGGGGGGAAVGAVGAAAAGLRAGKEKEKALLRWVLGGGGADAVLASYAAYVVVLQGGT